LRIHIIKSLKQSSREGENKDGMDMVLMRFMPDKKTLIYAGAHNGLYVHDGNELKEYKADKMPIGFYQVMNGFNENTVEIKKGDRIYAFTDGYPDQFGGPAGKKMKYAKLEKMIRESNSKSLSEQSELLDREFENWKGNYEQNDDVCMIGILI
jgi:phosphoserine phosphatase RsbU/P